MTNDNRLQLDERFEKCLVNKAFDIEALPTQRELLYTLTSGSSLIQIFRTMLTYIDADIQRLKSTATMTSNQCTQRYARETLCPICTTNASTNRIDESHDMNDPLCPSACRYVIKTCFNQSSNPYLAVVSIAKGYSAVIKEIERATNELKVIRVAECPRTRPVYFYSLSSGFRNCTSTSTIWSSTLRTVGTRIRSSRRRVHIRTPNHSVPYVHCHRSQANDATSFRTGIDRYISYSVNYNHPSILSLQDFLSR